MTRSEAAATVFVIDDSASVRESMNWLLTSRGLVPETFSGAADFLPAFDPMRRGCILLDIRMPGMNGLELMAELERRGNQLPIVMITGHGDIPMAVYALKHGAFHFLQKPFEALELLDTIDAALLHDRENRSRRGDHQKLRSLIDTLTPREMEVMKFVVAGESSKGIGKTLGISAKTVDIHRASILKKFKARNTAELIRAWMTVATPPRI